MYVCVHLSHRLTLNPPHSICFFRQVELLSIIHLIMTYISHYIPINLLKLQQKHCRADV